jgi:hypothetical protein
LTQLDAASTQKYLGGQHKNSRLKGDFKFLLSKHKAASGERIFTGVRESAENNCDDNAIATVSK